MSDSLMAENERLEAQVTYLTAARIGGDGRMSEHAGDLQAQVAEKRVPEHCSGAL